MKSSCFLFFLMLTKLLFVLLLVSTPGFGQRGIPHATKSVPKPGRFAGLLTTRQVQQFLRQQCKWFTLSDVRLASCVYHSNCVQSGTTKAWLRADFDGDGREDIVVVGHPSKNSAYQDALLCFLDTGKPRPQLIQVLYRQYHCPVLQLVRIKNQPAIRYTHVVLVGGRFEGDAKPVCQTDTLVVKNRQLVEYERTTKDYQIRAITFRTEACYGTCPIFELQLSRAGTAVYQAEEYNDRHGRFTATVAPAQVTELWHLLNSLHFPRLNSFYNIGITDQPTCILTIIYANGQVKTIEDYGEEGTLGLRQVYKLLFELRATQRWK
jgi:hypothetical protein